MSLETFERTLYDCLEVREPERKASLTVCDFAERYCVKTATSSTILLLAKKQILRHIKQKRRIAKQTGHTSKA